MDEEIHKLIQSRYIERIQNVKEDRFISPVITTVKEDKLVKITQESRKLNDSCIKMRSHTPIMHELLNQTSTGQKTVQNEPTRISKTDLENACRQLQLFKRTTGRCNFAKTRGSMNG